MSKKISDLTQLTAPDAADLLVIDDVSAATTKKIAVSDAMSYLQVAGTVTKVFQERTTNATTGASTPEVTYNGFSGTYTFPAVTGRTYAIKLIEPRITSTAGSGAFDFFVWPYINGTKVGKFTVSSTATGISFYLNQTYHWQASSTATASLTLNFSSDGGVTSYQMDAATTARAQLVVTENP